MSKGHVHFQDHDANSNVIVVRKSSNEIIDVYLGFVQFNHHYRIECPIDKDFLLGHATDTFEQALTDMPPNLALRFLNVEDNSNRVLMVNFNLFVYKDSTIRETLDIVFKTEPKNIKLRISAKVLGKGRGTPALRDGIKCIGKEQDELSEVSDFLGFD